MKVKWISFAHTISSTIRANETWFSKDLCLISVCFQFYWINPILNRIFYDSPSSEVFYMSFSPFRLASDHSCILWILARQRAVWAAAHLEHSSGGWLVAGQTEEGNSEVILKLLLLLGYYFGCLVYTSFDFCIRIQLSLYLNLSWLTFLRYNAITIILNKFPSKTCLML